MCAFQFTVAEDADDLAACCPGYRDVFEFGFEVVRQDDECGQLVGIDEERNALDIVFFGVGEGERFKNDVLRRDVAHGELFEEAASYVSGLEVALTVQKVVGHVSIPSVNLFSDAAPLFRIVVAIGKKATETVDATRKGFVTVAKTEANTASPAPVSLSAKGANATFHRDCCNQGHHASPTSRLELERAFWRKIGPDESDRVVLNAEGIDQFCAHIKKLSPIDKERRGALSPDFVRVESAHYHLKLVGAQERGVPGTVGGAPTRHR